MDSAEVYSEGGYGSSVGGLNEAVAADIASFHFANEKREKSGPGVKVVRKNTTVLRRRNVSKTVDDDPAARDSFESIRHKLSAISGPQVNNNMGEFTELYSTPVGKDGNNNEDQLKSCSGLGKSPSAADSGFASTMSSASKLATPIKSLFTSPNEKYFQEKKSSYQYPSTHSFSAAGKKSGTSKRLFETSHRDVTVFGVSFKLDEAIPVLVLVFVALSAVVTVTTLTTALRRSHDVARPAPANGKYRSIQFAYDQLMKEDDDQGFQVVDEHGNALGGKRAAIQFAFDLRDDGGEKVDIIQKSHLDTLDLFKTIDDMADADASAPEEVPEMANNPDMSDDEKRVRLLKHISSFGSPFATSQVAVLRKKRGAAKKSKNDHPFAAYKGDNKKKHDEAAKKSQRDVVEKNNFRFR